MSAKPNEPSPIGLAAEWVARLTVVGVEMVVFGLGGLWLDKRLRVEPLFTLLGFALGIGVGIFHLLAMTASTRTPTKPPEESGGGGPGGSKNKNGPSLDQHASRAKRPRGKHDASQREIDE